MPIQLDKFDDDDHPYSVLAQPKRPEYADDKLAREIYVVGAGTANAVAAIKDRLPEVGLQVAGSAAVGFALRAAEAKYPWLSPGLAIGGLALTGPACNTKEPGRDLRDLTQQEIMEQAINRLKDLRAVVTFTDTTRVLAKPVSINPSSAGLVVNSVLAVKKLGDTSEVVTHHTSKGITAYKLRLPDGACGYVFSTDSIRLTSQ